MKKLYTQEGKSLIEVLASVVIISFMFTIISSFFISSINHSVVTSKHFTSTQIAEALLHVYKQRGYSYLESIAGTTEIDSNTIKTVLGIDDSIIDPALLLNIESLKAKLEITKHTDSSIEDRVMLINITVSSDVNGRHSETSLEGYVRNE